jgi:hypothetical protein
VQSITRGNLLWVRVKSGKLRFGNRTGNDQLADALAARFVKYLYLDLYSDSCYGNFDLVVATAPSRRRGAPALSTIYTGYRCLLVRRIHFPQRHAPRQGRLYKFLRETVGIVNMLIGNGRQAWTHKFIEWLLAMSCFTDEHLAREDMALYLLRMISPDETRQPVLLLRVVCRLCLQSVEYKMERDDVFRQEVHSIQLARAQRS